METPQVANASFSKGVRQMLGFDLHWWEMALVVSLAVAAFAATAVGLATWAVILLQRAALKDSAEAFEKYKVEAGVKTEEAKAEAAEANKGAAQANERAENARLETERLKQLVVWRSISAEQRKILVKVLSTKREIITLMVVANDPEAFVFASQLTTVFSDAKWQAFAESASWGNMLPTDLILPGPDNETVKLLRSAFSAAGIAFHTHTVREPDTSIVFEQKEKPTARVIVGSRLGPLK